MDNSEIKEIKEKKSRIGEYGRNKEYYQNYQKNYYHNNIKDKMQECQCGLMIQSCKFARHLKTKKHQKLLETLQLVKAVEALVNLKNILHSSILFNKIIIFS